MPEISTFSRSSPEYWENCYLSGEMGWDLGAPTPILNNWINTCKDPLSICILGAGNGWDAVNFATKGHIVTAVDFAESAIMNMQNNAKQSDVEIDLLNMDIFHLNKIYTAYFDVVLEYTCYCAIDPIMRRVYIEMVRHILKPNGKFVALLFPIDKNPCDGGPPYAVELERTIEIMSEYLFLIKHEIPIHSVKSRVGREVFVIFMKNGKQDRP